MVESPTRKGNPSGTSAPTPTPPKSSFKHLLAFTCREDLWLLLGALATAAGIAAAKTLYAIILGRIFDVITRWGGQLIEPDDFLSEVSMWCLGLTLLGVATWAVVGLDALF